MIGSSSAAAPLCGYGVVNGAACVCAGDSIAGEQMHASHWCFSSYWQFGVVMQPMGAPAHFGTEGSGVCVICAP